MNKKDLTCETNNFFRYAQTALDDVLNNLRDLFKDEFQKKFKQVCIDKCTVYMLSFSLNAQLRELITVLLLFYFMKQLCKQCIVHNTCGTLYIGKTCPLPPCELVVCPGVCLGKYDPHVNL